LDGTCSRLLGLPLNQTAVVTLTEGVNRSRALPSRAGGSQTRINKDRTAGIEPRCDFVTGSLYRQRENAGGTASGLPQVLLPVQPEGQGVTAGSAVMEVAASDVFCGRQVTDLESFLLFFLFHFILLSNLVLPSVNFHLENSFLAVH
jgi:hypothetical protein